jgi:hypothetical protein
VGESENLGRKKSRGDQAVVVAQLTIPGAGLQFGIENGVRRMRPHHAQNGESSKQIEPFEAFGGSGHGRMK